MNRKSVEADQRLRESEKWRAYYRSALEGLAAGNPQERPENIAARAARIADAAIHHDQERHGSGWQHEGPQAPE